MRYHLFPVVILFANAAAAAKAPDLATSLAPPSAVYVYETGRYYITVANIGNKDATNSKLDILLPETHTSPQVYVMGILGAKSTACTRAGTKYTCTLGTIRRNRSISVFFDIALPQSTSPLEFDAIATTANDSNPANDTAYHTAIPINYDLPFTAPRDARNWHCTGTSLTAYFECTTSPTSITWHDTVFNLDESIDFIPPQPGFTGSWSKSSPEQLSFQYYDNLILVAEFSGYAVDDTACYEGMTTFPGSPYVSPYRVCLQ